MCSQPYWNGKLSLLSRDSARQRFDMLASVLYKRQCEVLSFCWWQISCAAVALLRLGQGYDVLCLHVAVQHRCPASSTGGQQHAGVRPKGWCAALLTMPGAEWYHGINVEAIALYVRLIASN